MLGAEVNIIAPKTLIPDSITNLRCKKFHKYELEGLKSCDIVMMLRLQNERMSGSFCHLRESIMNTMD